MSEFELSTLVMVVVLLAGLGGYSYWQIMRAQRQQRKFDAPFNETQIESFEREAEANVQAYVPSVAAKFAQAPVASDIYVRSKNPPVAIPGEVVAIQSIPTTPQTGVQDTPIETVEFEHIEVPIADTEALIAEPVEIPTQSFVSEEVSNQSFDTISEESAVVAGEASAKTDTEAAVQSANTDMVSNVSFYIEPSPTEEAALPVEDPQFFNQYDLTEQATLAVFDSLIRFSSWMDSTHPEPVYAIDAVLDLMVSQPKNAQDIERALYDLRLDTDLPLRLFGLRAGQVEAMHSDNPNAARLWQPLEMGALYSGLRLTLQLANAADYANAQLIHDWFELAQRLAKRLAAQVSAWPDPAALASYALYLHDLSKRLGAPIVVQLRKPQGLWAGYEVHQHMTQWGLQLDENGQYVARHADGRVLYRVLNDLNNPRAQDFYRDGLATMHVHTLSFCLDLARVEAAYQAEQRMWHDMNQLAHVLQANWCNSVGNEISAETLFSHAAGQIPAYLQQLTALGVPAGSITMKRLLQGSTA